MKQTKLDLIKYRIERAKQTIDEAKLAFDNNKFNLAENRIYYAIFYIVYALAVLKDFSTSKHITLKGWFNKEFIFRKKLDKELYQIYNKAFGKRQESDYDDFVEFSEDEVKKDFDKMKKFLKTLEEFIIKEIENS